jgi:hypothetical protein
MARTHRIPAWDKARSDLRGWRVEFLASAGFDRELAERIAADRRYDLHGLLGLVDRGCPPQLAAQILAPLEEAKPRC